MIIAIQRDTGISGTPKKDKIGNAFGRKVNTSQMNNMQNSPLIQADSEHKNVIYLLLTEGVTKILSFLSFAIMARGLSQQSYGVVALAFSVGSLFYIFFNLGLDYHVIRDIRYFLKTNDSAAFHELASTVATLKVWFLPVFLGIFVLVFSAMRWDRVYFPVMILIFLYFYIVSTTQLVFFFFRAFEKIKYEFTARVFQAILLLAATFLFVYFYKNPVLLAVGYAAIASAILLGMFIFFVKKLKFTPQIHQWMKKRELVLIGKTKYLFLTGIATSIFSGTDILIISKVSSIGDVAIYKNAVMITLALFMIPAAVVQGFYPKLVQHTTELSYFFRLVKKIIVRLIPLGLVIATILFVIAGWLINGLFGNTYSPSVPLFRFSLLAFIFATVNHVLGYGLIALGRYRASFLLASVYAALSVLLNIILIPKTGLWGGILTMNIVQFVAILLPLIYLYFLKVYSKNKEALPHNVDYTRNP